MEQDVTQQHSQSEHYYTHEELLLSVDSYAQFYESKFIIAVCSLKEDSNMIGGVIRNTSFRPTKNAYDLGCLPYYSNFYY